MINFKDKADQLPSTLIVVAIVVMVLTAIYMVVVPVPTIAGIAARPMQTMQTYNLEIAAATRHVEVTREQILPLVWTGGTETNSASVLSELTADATKDQVAISAFRPQRTTNLVGLTELPITIQLAGAYGGVHKLMSQIDSSGSKIVLRSAQFSASQANSNGIAATLGISIYMPSDPTLLSPPPKVARHK